MAKFDKAEKKRNMEYPSDYGSHASMIDEEATADLKDDSLVALRDSIGVYVTERKRLDNGMADTNRHTRIDSNKF